MLTDAEVAYYRRILNITPEKVGPERKPKGRTHGKVATYRRGGCRCDACRAAHNEATHRHAANRKQRAGAA